MADDLTAGTTTPAAAEPATPGTTAGAVADGKTGAEAVETPDLAQVQAELAETRRKFDELLRNKSNYEGWEREREDLYARLNQPPATGGGQAQLVAEIQAAQVELQQEAAQGDRRAILMLSMLGALQQQPGQVRQELELRDTPESDRKEVERLQQERWQRGEKISVATAREILDAQRLRQQADAVKKREDELRRAEEARRQGVVATHVRGVPASELRSDQPMTFSEYRIAMDNAKSDEERDALIKKSKRGTNLVPG